MNKVTFDDQHINIPESTVTVKKSVFTKTDVKTLGRGLRRMLIAIVTAVLFALSVLSFILVATATGYWAVVLFISAIVLMLWAFVFLYAQGITENESQGENK